MTIEEDIAAQAEYEAEAMWVTQNYQPLIDHYEAVTQRLKAFEEQCRALWSETASDENMGDC